MNWGRVWSVLLAWCIGAFAYGQVVEQEEGVIDGSFQSGWDRAVEHLGVPGALTRPEEVKVFAVVTGGYVRVTFAGFSGQDAQRLAEVLDEWNGTGEAAEYGDDEAGPSAVSWVKSGRFGQESATSTADLGALQELLIKEGFEPYLALSVPVKAGGLPELEVAYTSRYWSLLKVEKEWPTVTLTTRLERYDVLVAGAILYVPFLVLMGSGLGIWLYCRRPSVALPKRRLAYTYFVFFGVVLFLPLNFTAQYVAIETGAFTRVANVWAGESFANLTSFVFLASFLVALAPFGILVAVIDRKYIKERDESGKVLEEPTISTETVGGREEASSIRLVIRAIALPLAMILAVAIPEPFRAYGLVAGGVLVISTLDYRGLRQGLKRDPIDSELAGHQDDDLVRPVIRVAQLMGARLKSVKVSRGGKPGSQTGVTYSLSEVTVGADLVDVADEETLDAAVAFAIAGARRANRNMVMYFGTFWAGSVTLGAITVFFELMDRASGFLVIPAVPLLFTPIVILLLRRSSQYREPGRVAIWKTVISTLRTVRGARRYAVILGEREWPVVAVKPSDWDEVGLVERAAKELGYDPRDPAE